ncbi:MULTISPECIES: hypothetical protein [unclassified Kitasatospora]|uniref:hypothetical protein n=1 Tax=unclassified Kitasatospora TaxID=2633591 RepID=UPI00071052DC|nr:MULTISPECIES: hypothetical protein [unclassified Kitasatospora]KQV14277.1 hypothetical protein ASC99_31905 [Kitasatospora sp. Root107]KRB72391.1 hypothetical protein ASE03_23000 [Kitasatospora sp. Root187]
MKQDITRQLHEAAGAHQPDRARMLARMERGAADPVVRHRARTIGRSWRKAALAGLATAGILATGGLAVAAIVGTPSPAPVIAPVITPVTPSPTVTSPPAPSARPTAASPAPATTPGSSHPTPSASSRVQNGPLWSAGSMGANSTVFWAQNNITLRTTRPLTSLTVELRVAQTGGVRDTGNWRTLPSDDFTVTAQESGGALLYRWVLKPGRTVPAGQHMFAGQYNHATGVRSTTGDSYRMETSDGAAVWGGFAPTH